MQHYPSEFQGVAWKGFPKKQEQERQPTAQQLPLCSPHPSILLARSLQGKFLHRLLQLKQILQKQIGWAFEFSAAPPPTHTHKSCWTCCGDVLKSDSSGLLGISPFGSQPVLISLLLLLVPNSAVVGRPRDNGGGRESWEWERSMLWGFSGANGGRWFCQQNRVMQACRPHLVQVTTGEKELATWTWRQRGRQGLRQQKTPTFAAAWLHVCTPTLTGISERSGRACGSRPLYFWDLYVCNTCGVEWGIIQSNTQSQSSSTIEGLIRRERDLLHEKGEGSLC